MARKAFISTLVIAVALGLFVYFTSTGRALLGRVWGGQQRAANTAITNRVKSAVLLSRRLSAFVIGVDTKDGVVKLTGRVPTEVDKDLAGNVAKDVPEVLRVDNQLQVDPGVMPSEGAARESNRVTDLEIRADLIEKLAKTQGLPGQNVQASVQDRIVTLGGRVETPAQKARAEQLAMSVASVVSVVNRLEVSNPAAAQNETPVAAENELSNRVMFALFKEREDFANVGAIKVTRKDNAVTLTGSVASRAERALAERIAREVDGVKSISNQLSVSSQSK